MSETARRATPSVNIDEFERRLRATGSLGAAQDDPLAELARLLGAEEPPTRSDEAPEVKPAAPPPEPEAPPPPLLRPASRVDAAQGQVVNVDFSAQTAVASPAEPPPLLAEPPPYAEHPAAPPPLLRAPGGRSRGEEPARRKVWPVAALVVIGVAGGAGAWAYRGGVPSLVAKTPPLIMAAAGPTKVQPPSQATVSSPNDIASLIAKDEQNRAGPGKIVSTEEQPVDLNERAKLQAAAEARAAAPPPSPPTIAAAPMVVVAAPSSAPPAAPATAPAASAASVSSSSPPPQPSAPTAPPPAAQKPAAAPAPVSAPPAAAAHAAAATPAPSPAAAPSAPPQAVARSVAVAAAAPSPVAPLDSIPIAPGAGTVGPTVAPPAPPTPFPEPKRVKTVSVRPDGSIIAPDSPPDDQPAQPLEPPNLPANPPVPVPRPAIDAAAAEPATPKLDLPTKLSGKTTTRVAIPKIDTTAATTGQPPEAPLQIAPSSQSATPKKHEAGHAAAAEAAPPAPAAAPAPAQQQTSGPQSLFAALSDAAHRIVPSEDNGAAGSPVRTASAAQAASAPPAAAEGTGDYAVQLAAPRTDAEARSIAKRLESKYASELGGAQLVIHKAELKGKTIYRVRTAKLSHAAAISLCEKLKAAGGACFLARE